MSAGTFFARAAEILKANPPHIVDQPILARVRRIGIVPGEPFDINRDLSSVNPRRVSDARDAALFALVIVAPSSAADSIDLALRP